MQPTKLYLLRQTKPQRHSLGVFTDFDKMLQAAKFHIESHRIITVSYTHLTLPTT